MSTPTPDRPTRCDHGRDSEDCSTCHNMAAAAAAPGRKFAQESKDAYDAAMDWLLNSRHTADPDIQDAFWGIVDGRYSVEGADKR